MVDGVVADAEVDAHGGEGARVGGGEGPGGADEAEHCFGVLGREGLECFLDGVDEADAVCGGGGGGVRGGDGQVHGREGAKLGFVGELGDGARGGHGDYGKMIQ